jgi:hypothetical protein
MATEIEKILVHRNEAAFKGPLPEGVTLTGSPMNCIGVASSGTHDLIAVCFDYRSLRETHGLVELCGALKKMPNLRETPLMAVLPSPHRKLMEELHRAGVDYIDSFDPDSPTWLDDVLSFAKAPTETEQALSHICPYLNYQAVDGRNELVTCGAYRDRLVVGRELSKKFCHCDNHRNCKYYRNPIGADDKTKTGKARRRALPKSPRRFDSAERTSSKSEIV